MSPSLGERRQHSSLFSVCAQNRVTESTVTNPATFEELTGLVIDRDEHLLVHSDLWTDVELAAKLDCVQLFTVNFL